MSSLHYVGPGGEQALDIKSRLDTKEVPTITQSAVETEISNQLADRALQSEVDAQAGLRASTVYLDQRASGYYDQTTLGSSQGILQLDSNGKVPTHRLPARAGERRWTTYSAPTAWSIGRVDTRLDNPKVLTTFTIPDPGYSCYPLFTGFVELGDIEGIEVQVRYGGTHGTMYARAMSQNWALYEGRAIMPAGPIQPVRGGYFAVVAGLKFDVPYSQIGGQHSLQCFMIPA